MSSSLFKASFESIRILICLHQFFVSRLQLSYNVWILPAVESICCVKCAQILAFS